MHLGGFEISFIYSCTCRSVIVTMKKRKKKEKEKKEKGEKKKGKEARRAAGAVSDAAEPFSSRRCSLVVALAILRPHPLPNPFFFFSLLLSSLSLSSPASQSLSSAALPVFNSHFSEAFQSVTPRLAANTPPPPPPPPSLRSSLSSSLSLYSRSLDIATTPRPNGTNKRLPFPLSAI